MNTLYIHSTSRNVFSFYVVLYAKDEGSRFDESLAEPFQMELHQHVACLLATRLSANWRAKIYANIL